MQRTPKSNVSYLEAPSLTSQRPSLLKRGAPRERRSILQRTRPSAALTVVLLDGVDVTPVRLDPCIYEGSTERQISMMDSLGIGSSANSTLSFRESQKFQTTILQQKQEINSMFAQRSFRASLEDTFVNFQETSDWSKDIFAEELSSVTTLDHPKPIPQQISLLLQETETFFLLDLPSSTVSRGTTEGDLTEEDNKQYQYITVGKGKNRKMVNVGIQTIPALMKARDTDPEKYKFSEMGTSVSVWEMFDTYHEKKDTEKQEEVLQTYQTAEHRLNKQPSTESFRISVEDKQMENLIKKKEFRDAIAVLERILASNCYNEEQKRYKGLSNPEPLREDIDYKYRLNLLWTFANQNTRERCVSSISFNSHNEDIIAAGYGKFFFNDQTTIGSVMVWNIKNPTQPEREYTFDNLVSSVAFSNKNPSLLAVGFYNGDINIVDVSDIELSVVRMDQKASFEPVWSIVWAAQGDKEDILASFGDGRVVRFELVNKVEMKSIQIMVTAMAEGNLKGLNYLKPCATKDIAISRYSAATCLALHPMDPFTYFVGTSEGVLHRCSINYYNQHMDLFKAHQGTVHVMKFSPFADKLFLTCGDDFRGHLWADGIHEPLVTTQVSLNPVMGHDWSPLHCTIIASINGPNTLVWDFQRKLYSPQSSTKSPTGSKNTVLQFSKSGQCLIVGDVNGDLHVYSLEDVPIPPFFPEDLVCQSLRKLLITRPDLLKKLEKLGPLNFDKEAFSKYFN